ncbi:hypothetical protein P154DRAFT_520148 [Amniculicola lignicola CBS 123094]|uniref:Uncharacterized protein n=1 Tax=Amniculicola lignicola CBS 123094 TaxID=1392246 RepID=A0A6A5WVS0_9PLEO|nr:hypothetical protein P154DRAFT_520148 [Amniculicola lignicola CBS 123094]
MPQSTRYATIADREGCLVNFYLNSHHPIYECNECNVNGKCRANYHNKNVPFKRQVELAIFIRDS